MAELIYPNGVQFTVTPLDESRKKLTLIELQALVGGYIEYVKTVDGRVMYVDEDGRMKKLPANPVAACLTNQPIVGTALVREREEVD